MTSFSPLVTFWAKILSKTCWDTWHVAEHNSWWKWEKPYKLLNVIEWMKYEFAKLCINNNKVQSFYLISEWNGPHTVVKLHFMSSWIFGNIQNPKLWFLTIFYMPGQVYLNNLNFRAQNHDFCGSTQVAHINNNWWILTIFSALI